MCNKPTLDLLGSLLNWHGMPDCANSIDNIPWGTLFVVGGGGKGAQPMHGGDVSSVLVRDSPPPPSLPSGPT